MRVMTAQSCKRVPNVTALHSTQNYELVISKDKQQGYVLFFSADFVLHQFRSLPIKTYADFVAQKCPQLILLGGNDQYRTWWLVTHSSSRLKTTNHY